MPSNVRHCLQVADGDGYWDFYKPWAAMMLSVTDATYRGDQPLTGGVEGRLRF